MACRIKRVICDKCNYFLNRKERYYTISTRVRGEQGNTILQYLCEKCYNKCVTGIIERGNKNE